MKLKRIILLLLTVMFSFSYGEVFAKDGNSLKKALKNKFLIGVSVNTHQSSGKDVAAVEIVKKNFNSIVAENCMKSSVIHPKENKYNFAQADEFVNRREGGLEAELSQGGANLSGGERQRISIARCILKDAPIVILDEATASVDADNESAIQQAVNELCAGKTLLVIAHRLNTVKNANRILVVDDGRIAQSGTHEELAASAGIYRDMVDAQGRGAGWLGL